MAVVVLPTPPFWFAMARIMGGSCSVVLLDSWGGETQRQDAPPLAPRELDAAAGHEVRRQLGILFAHPEEDAPLGSQTVRESPPRLGIEPQSSRGDHVDALRQAGGQRN